MSAIGTGGLLIVAGDLLCSPYRHSSSLCSIYNDLGIACDIHELATNLENQVFHGENAYIWLNNKGSKAKELSERCAVNAKSECVLFYIGNILTTLGFSSLLLVFASERFYSWVSSIQPYFSIVSFMLLLVCMMLKESGEYSLEELLHEKSEVAEWTRTQLQRENLSLKPDNKKQKKDEQA